MTKPYLVTAARVQLGFVGETPTTLELLVGTAYRSVPSLHRHSRVAGKGHDVLVDYTHLPTGRRFRYDSRHRNVHNGRDQEVYA